MVELRKRKAAPPPPVAKKIKSAIPSKPKPANSPSPADAPKVPQVDDLLDLENFGGEIETHEGTKTSLKKLVDDSTSGVVLFTYPKASTPGCTWSLDSLGAASQFLTTSLGTKQVCLFRDNYTHLTSTGLSIYGLSADSPRANTTFKTKQNLSYSLLCNPTATLIGAIGLKKTPRGTVRGVFAVDKEGKVLLREAGGPDATMNAVQNLVAQDSKERDQDGDQTED